MTATTADLGPPIPEPMIMLSVKEYIRLRNTADKSVQRKIALRQLNAAHEVACLTMELMARRLNQAQDRLNGELRPELRHLDRPVFLEDGDTP